MKNLVIYLNIIALLFALPLWADQPRSSDLHIWAENDNVYVLHSHKAIAWTVETSEIKIVTKATGEEVFSADTTPFTKLVSVENGRYFAGLSDLQAGSLSHGYNFALFTPDGEFLSKVFVSRDAGYCEKVRQSVSQYLGWFAREPRIKLVRSEGKVSKIIVQPYYHDSKPCELPIGVHIIHLEKE
ncbi:hypothetical protein [Marinagarivorans algicola]|uniref:hypothetical protein n=1 Tax=Marinagarivorans algicola TaxID=1513270 RepID=UPI0006B5835D|nr:hypothetical protein [Marinagarivorans algicola]